MSHIEQPRIKQIRQKGDNNSYPISIPIGADSFLIDMVSGLDLEEELKLGNNHYVEITENNNTTIIKEWYFSEPKKDRDISNTNEESLGMKQLGLITYSAQIEIAEDEINMYLYKGNIPETESEKEQVILHSKKIKITNGTTTIINEEVDA